jgi:phage baseplate assembly protein W
MNIDFIGQGWSFPVESRHEGGVLMSSDETNIEQAIWIILATAPGERVLRPNFGCGIHDLVFSINDAKTQNDAVLAVRQALLLWEPRIDVLAVTTETKSRGEVLLINIQYRVRTTNNFFNMVFPFYLDRTSNNA